MAEWKILLFVCIVGMGLLATIAFLFGKTGDLWPAVFLTAEHKMPLT